MMLLVADDTTGPRCLQPSVLRSESFREYQVASPSCYTVTLSIEVIIRDSARQCALQESKESKESKVLVLACLCISFYHHLALIFLLFLVCFVIKFAPR